MNLIALLLAAWLLAWAYSAPSGHRPVALAHTSTSGHSHTLSLASFRGPGKSSVRRDAQVRTVPGSTWRRLAISVEPTHSPPWSLPMSSTP